ncbi:SPX domain-containing protein, partial [Syncephalis pseudoplumigaleata]
VKFSHQLKFNAVPEWSDHYVAYPQLKKLIYQLERHVLARAAGDEETLAENRPLLDAHHRANDEFLPVLDRELSRVTEFYVAKEGELYDELGRLLADINTAAEATARTASEIGNAAAAAAAAEGNFRDRMQRRLSLRSETSKSPVVVTLPSQALRQRALNIYIALADLESYVQLNYTAFTKILKKYDKVTGNHLRKRYVQDSVRAAYLFHEQTKARLEEQTRTAAWAHGEAAGIRDPDENELYLNKHLRERVVFERNTIWRDMIGMERKVAAIGVEQARPDHAPDVVAVRGVRIPRWLLSRKAIIGVMSIIVFIALLRVKRIGEETDGKCFALLLLVCSFWIFEASAIIPLFVTALLVPLLAVILGTMKDDGGVLLPPPKAAKMLFESMFSPAIVMLLAGFTLAAALTRHDISRRAATFVLSRAGTHPAVILLACMGIATFSSMWITNVAAPPLCFSVIQSILRTLPPDAPFARCLIMGIALASNVGGMASPISSPQNMIAIATMETPPTWAQWFIIALPVVILTDVLIWLLLLRIYRPTRDNTPIQPIYSSNDPWTGKQHAVVGIAMLSVFLWCFELLLRPYLGNVGIISLIPIILYFGSGLLTKEDFNNFLWTVIMLAMGGIALGKAVEGSGLLAEVTMFIRAYLRHWPHWLMGVMFVAVTALAATFISHTVAAIIFLPFIYRNSRYPYGSGSCLFVMAATFMCSGAMGLPISGFPNINAAMLEDATGRPYVTTKDFLRAGIPVTFATLLVVLTVGSAIILALGI